MSLKTDKRILRLPEIVGRGYGTFWNFKGRYRVCKGSRASKKSKTTALNQIAASWSTRKPICWSSAKRTAR